MNHAMSSPAAGDEAAAAGSRLRARLLRARPAPAGVAAIAPNPAPPAAPGLPAGDWHDMLDAVKDRLRASLHDVAQTDVSPLQPGRLQPTPAGVLECVAALDQLQDAVRGHLGQCQRLELQLFEAQTALAQAQAELAGTQAGERHARHLATHDPLTSLANRSLFRERLDHALSQPSPQRGEVAVLFVDLDDFKPVNDRHGHAVGDEVLRIVAMRLKRAVRADDLVSRLGGDEFACLVTNGLDHEQLTRMGCKLFDAVSAPLMVGELRLSVTPSIGIAMRRGDHDTEPDALLQRADAAMYRAKRERSGVALCIGDATRVGT